MNVDFYHVETEIKRESTLGRNPSSTGLKKIRIVSTVRKYDDLRFSNAKSIVYIDDVQKSHTINGGKNANLLRQSEMAVKNKNLEKLAKEAMGFCFHF